jgi:hypothetical protein
MANAVPMLAGVGLLSMCCISSSLLAGAMGGSETPEESTTSTPIQPTEYVYDFIVAEQPYRTKDFNIHITDIEADDVRVTPEQLTIHEEPEWAKCNSKEGGYECEGDNYGMIDPEPADGEYKDVSWSAWKAGQAEVGTKVFTVTTSTKVKKFKIDYFRPKYVPGWTIKENGKEVLTTSKGRADENTPAPVSFKYQIP